MFRMSEKQFFPAVGGSVTKGLCLFGLLFGLLIFGAQAQANEGHNGETHHESGVQANISSDGLLPIPVEVPKPRTNEECIKCHKEQHLTSGRLDGSPANLHIEYDEFKLTLHGKKLECVDCHEDAAAVRHCRSGFQKVNCLACHSKIKGLFPFGARERLKKKKIRIPKRKMVGGSYYESKHGKALLAGKKNAPNCYNCHTRHYVYGAKNIKSSVNRANLTATCGVCHKERQLKTMLERLATFRLEAHRKGDLSFDYDRGNCIDCHQGNAVHGKQVNDAPCSRCHDTTKKIEPVSLFGLGPFHLYPNPETQYTVWCARNLYGALLIVLASAALIWLLFYILRAAAEYYRKEEGGEE